MKSGIYRIRNVISGKEYIGSSCNVRRRLTAHKWRLNNKLHTNPILQASWGVHGESAFIFEIIELCGIESLIEREQYWIDEASSRVKLFNVRLVASSNRGLVSKQRGIPLSPQRKKSHQEGCAKRRGVKRPEFDEEWRKAIGQGSLGHITSEETKKKLSIANKGKKRTPEQVDNIRRGLLGKSKSEEAKRNMSESRRKWFAENGPYKRSPVSEESRERMRKANKEAWARRKAREIGNG